MKYEMKKELLSNLVWAAIMIPLAFAAAFAYKHGYISADTKLRVVAMNGLWIAWYGNQLPKAAMPSAYTQQIRRVAGWSLVLSGLIYAGMFAFAPIHLAFIVGGGAVVAGVAGTFGYCLWVNARQQRARREASDHARL